jgi:hypothetical protein
MGRPVRQAQPALTKATETLACFQDRPHTAPDAAEAQAWVAARQAAVQPWAEVQRTYCHPRETRSLLLPPCCLAALTLLTSAQVARARQQVPALAALGERWWEGVEHALTHTAISAPWRPLGQGVTAAWGYGEPHVAPTRGARRQAKRRQACEAVRATGTHVKRDTP